MKIVINRTDAIGDLLLTLPMLRVIKDKLPETQITLLVSPRVRGLLENIDFIDQIWEIDQKRSRYQQVYSLFRRFRDLRPDIYLHVGGSFVPTIAAKLAFVPKIGGLISKPLSYLLLNSGVRQRRSIVEMHESEYNINLLAPFGISVDYREIEKYGPIIGLNEVLVRESLNYLKGDFTEAGLSGDKPFIVVHPGMTGHTLNWSSKNYARLVSQLNDKLESKYNFIISFTPSDNRYLQQFKEELRFLPDRVRGNILFFDGSRRGLNDYINILSNAVMFIGPSTGTMHIANALKVKTIALFSPIKVQSAHRWGPFYRTASLTKVIVPQTVCGEQFRCAQELCPYYDCMSTIEVEDVVNEALSLMGRL